jgi:hypothetical protein
MSSIGYSSPINGSNVASQFLVANKKNSGGAIRGYMPPTTQNVEKRYHEYEHIRFILKNSWNTSYPGQLRRDNVSKPIVTPFRAVNNAGDLLSRKDYSCGGASQTPQSRPGLYGLKTSMGHNQNDCDGTGIPPATCNVKYVYDSSDYSRYLKQMAIQKNFNVLNNGGDQSSASQSAWRAIRRY